MRSLMLGLMGTTVLAGSAGAQDTTAVPTVQEAIRGAQPMVYTVPACDLGDGHFVACHYPIGHAEAPPTAVVETVPVVATATATEAPSNGDGPTS